MKKEREPMKKERESEDLQHQWAPLVAQVEGENIPIPVFVCLKCGSFKVGTHTIKISKNRLDMGNKPINNASEVHGTVYYS